MTAELLVGMGSALWIGILTAISPCPLATNIAAISFIGRQVAHPRAAVATGLLYGLGRSLVYVALAAVLVSSVLSAPALSQGLQRYMNKLLGPLLILVGMFLLGLIRIRATGSGLGAKVGERVKGWGVWAGLALGVVFALSFCPLSAALYFGSLIPLALTYESRLLLPLLYGVGTALPVFVFAVLIALGTHAVGRTFDRITLVERWARGITGAVFIVVGIGFSVAFIYRA
ncbi:MAG: aromatic aminobenezylarsenical efflux permease ArsG family transporter [Planctomycetota bacterium]